MRCTCIITSEEKDKKYGAWLYADGLNKPPSHDSFSRGRNQKQPAPQPSQNISPREKVIYLETLDAATSPSKEGRTNMQMDPAARKRLALDGDQSGSNNVANNSSRGVLALTEGKGEDEMENSSPSSTNNSKRARVDLSNGSDDRSAASFEEDRREQ